MPLIKFATFTLAALLAFGACASEEDARVVRVTRNIGGRPGFQVHWDIWKATFERQNPDWTLELIDLGNEDAGAYYRRAIATGDLPHVVMTLDYWGWTPGYFISIEDYPPTGFVLTLARIMQEIQAGNRDIDALLKMLDDDWEAGRKGNK